MQTDGTHVLVIGAGFGGLCLAHGLKRAGIAVTVFERYETRTDGLFGFRVGIDPTGSRALAECLPADLFDTFAATCARPPGYFTVLTEKLKRTATIKLPNDSDPVDKERSVSRQTLRQVLLTGLEDEVEFGKTFTHYDQHDDGTVTAHFADGTSATGTVLVAADGARSTVRKQYLPEAIVKPAGIIAIGAKVALTDETRALLPREVTDGIGLVFAPKGGMCIWHTMEFKWDDAGVKNGNDAALIAQWPGLRFDNTRDYIGWGFWAATGRFPANVADLRGEELIELTLKLTEKWHPNMRKLFAMSDPATPFPITIVTSEPVEPWKTTNITLLGDAIHTMTPGQGVGANTALRDAALLCRRLTEAHNGDRTPVDAIAEYEAEMIPYGFARVAESLAQNGTSGDDPLHKPFIGRLVLAMNRTYFRAVSRIPPLRRKYIADLSTYRGAE